jgi:hypothetical protein
MKLPREAIWACQAEFSAAFKRASAFDLRAIGQPHAELLRMAMMEERAAAALWDQLALRGISRPGRFVKRNG